MPPTEDTGEAITPEGLIALKAEIAELERNSPKTIRQHVTQIYSKCGARNRAEFIRAIYFSANERGEADD